MTHTQTLLAGLKSNKYDGRLLEIYVSETAITYQKDRLSSAIEKYQNYFGSMDVSVFSAPGRSEIIGNHTDHQHGEVIAAAIDKDTIAVVGKSDKDTVTIVSEGYDKIEIHLSDLSKKENELGTTTALVRGVLSNIKERGYRLCGFYAYITSDVLIGSGLSSSAAFEVLIGTIVNGLINDFRISPAEIAMIGQFAENNHFGKPCGLMDQMASSVGGFIHIDFENPQKPFVEKIDYDIRTSGYTLCITDTKSSHSDLTADYAAIPYEMHQVAEFFHKEYLREISTNQILENIDKLRENFGDRALLRALHFVNENARVREAVSALQSNDIDSFIASIKESGNSSFKYLQNVYTSKDISHQEISLALALSDIFLNGNGVSRIHGGGFAGTIQAFVKTEFAAEYQDQMNRVFGEGACSILNIRKYGGIQLL